MSKVVQSLLSLSNRIPNWTLDKIGIPKIQVPIDTTILYPRAVFPTEAFEHRGIGIIPFMPRNIDHHENR